MTTISQLGVGGLHQSFSIHAGVLAGGSGGNHVSDTNYDDANPDQIETLPDTQIHRNVGLELINVDKEGTLESSPPSHVSLLTC